MKSYHRIPTPNFKSGHDFQQKSGDTELAMLYTSFIPGDCDELSKMVEDDSNIKKIDSISDDLKCDLLNDFSTKIKRCPSVKCDMVNGADTKCLEQSLLGMWSYDEEKVNSLTQEGILSTINSMKISPYFG